MSPALSIFPTDLSGRPTADAGIETMFHKHDLSSGLMYVFEAPLSNSAVTAWYYIGLVIFDVNVWLVKLDIL